MQALVDNGTWEWAELPKGRKAIGSKWVFKIKRDPDGNIERYKARLIAQGYGQRPGGDFNPGKTFAPTMKMAAIRALLGLAALEDWEVESVDISNAYLNGVMPEDEVVYMKQAPSHEECPTHWVYRLKKGLYGLKQAGRLWYQRLAEVLESAGYKRLVSDMSIYVWERKGIKVIIPVFVDDVTIMTKSIQLANNVKTLLNRHFKVRNLVPISFLLGIAITRDRKNRTMWLSQRQYIIDLLDRFGMSTCAPVLTPMEPGLNITKEDAPKTEEERREMLDIPYQAAVGALNYLAVASRPDISYAVHRLARFNNYPGKRMWLAVKHLFRYLQGTKDLKLTYAPDPFATSIFTTFADSDFAGDRDSGRSTNGYLVKIGTGAVSWSSKLQGPIAKSSTEAEFYGASYAGTEIKWMRNLLGEIGYNFDKPSPLHLDNQSTIQVLNDAVHHSRMKHIPVQEFWIRNEVANEKNIEVHYLPTELMPADILTKPLPQIFVKRHHATMGLL